jgi:hypothetical protein
MRSAAMTFTPLPMNPARVARVLLGAAASVALLVLGFRWMLDARELVHATGAGRPEFLELAFRFGGVALLAAGQAIGVMVVLAALYRQRRGEWFVAAGLVTIFLAAALAAAVFALCGA